MREVTKRLLRLTPFVTFASLTSSDLSILVADAFDAALEGLAGVHVNQTCPRPFLAGTSKESVEPRPLPPRQRS